MIRKIKKQLHEGDVLLTNTAKNNFRKNSFE